MLWWLIFGSVLAVVGAILTLGWWRVGDQWADEEHKKFHGRERSGAGHAGAQVVRDFERERE